MLMSISVINPYRYTVPAVVSMQHIFFIFFIIGDFKNQENRILVFIGLGIWFWSYFAWKIGVKLDMKEDDQANSKHANTLLLIYLFFLINEFDYPRLIFGKIVG